MRPNEIMAGQHERIVRIVLTYALFALAWILLSDQVLAWVLTAPGQVIVASTLKGWLFVLVTSLLLYAQIRSFWLQLDQALREKLEALSLLRSIVDGSQDAIFAKDLGGRYLLMNRAGRSQLGRTEAEVIGKDDRDLFPAAQAEALMACDQQVMRSGQSLSEEETLATAAGPELYQVIKGPLHGPDGRVTGCFGISRNLTRLQQQIEQDRRAAASAEAQAASRTWLGDRKGGV